MGRALASCARCLLAAVAAASLLAAVGAPRIVAAPPQTRVISLYNIHTQESLTVPYKKNGKYIATAMDQINWILRDWRKNEKAQMDPALVDLLWEIHTELGSREPIHIISGYRSRATNEKLRKTVGGQASESRHILGKAADVHFPDVPLKKIRYSALIRERGGVGYYPTSATPFVHVDTDRVRHWPRMPRHELALLFPNGRTQHVPADGSPIGPADARAAQARHKDLALQVADFHAERKGPKRPVVVADAGGPAALAVRKPGAVPNVPFSTPPAAEPPLPAPQLVAEPRLVDRPSRLRTMSTDDDRQKLAQLAALASRTTLESGPAPARPSQIAATEPKVPMTLGGSLTVNDSSSWVPAPAYDEEHPEELSYRPFPLAPYMTATPSPDDRALVRMVHPDPAMTLELLDQAGAMPPMRLRPGQQVAQLLWAQQFKGEAVALDVLVDPPASAPDALSNRRVKTSNSRH
jgi:uncharacterized protein YcbK (DUF882 family)